jgi:hypothetical protein
MTRRWFACCHTGSLTGINPADLRQTSGVVGSNSYSLVRISKRASLSN